MSNPAVSPVILMSPVETGYAAYDPRTDQLHRLNPVAALITELCDGTRDIESIKALVGPLLPADQVNEIGRFIDEGIKSGLLVWNDGKSSPPREFSAKELYDLSRRLWDHGNVQPAFLCCQRAVQLQPDFWDAWYDLGDLAQSVGRREEARHAFQTFFDAHPADAEIEHLLVALRDDAPPPRASDRTISQIYKGFAATYEERMLADLKYQGPQRLLDAIKSVAGEQSGLRVLDLGCGSGLSGIALKPLAADMTGIDLSPEMLELARARNIYDRLEAAEITQWLEKTERNFDLIVSCDCLIYFGDLSAVASAAAKRLVPGGIFAFSTERGEKFPFQLTDTGRYAHHPDHIREAAAAAGLAVRHLSQAFLRMEYGSEVTGNFAVLVKDGTGS